MAGTEVIVYRSTDPGAPTLSGTAGSLIAVFDACLVNGYNSKSVQSITRSGSTATVTFATAHGLNADTVTKFALSGAAQSEYNGVKTIFNVTANTFDFTVAGTPATPATGTITGMIPPLGWGKPFSGTNLAAYRSAEVTGTRMFLRVNDTGAQTANLVGYETMSDVNTGSGLFPTAVQQASGEFLDKSNAADSSARPWVLFGDGFEFMFCYAYHATTYAGIYRVFHFGDPASTMTSDPYGCLIAGQTSASPAGSPNLGSTGDFAAVLSSTTLAAQAGHFYARGYSQTGTSSPAAKLSDYIVGGIYHGGASYLNYPTPNNNALYISPIYTISDTFAGIRGILKSHYRPLHSRPFGHGVLIPAADSPIGRRLYSVATPYSGSTPGETLFDIDGPWR